MTTLTLELPENLAPLKGSLERYLPLIVELRTLGLTTPTRTSAEEAIDFLWSNPTSQDVLDFKASERALERLLTLRQRNEAGTISDSERSEFDEAILVERIMRRAKLIAAKHIKHNE